MNPTRKDRLFVRILYGSYAWIALLIIVIPITFMLIVLPGIMRRRRVVSAGASLWCRAIGAPVKLTGWQVPEQYPCIMIANHASYLDGIVLTAALPPRFAFLIKQEMANFPVAGFVLRQLASEFVDRRNPKDRHRTAKRLVETARKGWTLAVFPEGTFDEYPGLKPFHSGAFKAAWSGNLPILPVIIHGAREKMPSGSFLPGRGSLAVHVCEPIEPTQCASVEALEARARAAILEHLDEPDLDVSELESANIIQP